MLKNIFLTSFRILLREKLFTIINIIGLAIGLGVFTLIFMYYTHEKNFDTHFPESDRIFRVTTDMIWEEGARQETAVTPGPTGFQMHAEFPEIISFARILPSERILIESESAQGEVIKHYENNVIYTEHSFFDLFRMQVLEALNPSNILPARSIIITEEVAKKYFGKNKAIGKTLLLDHSTPYTITGIVESFPENTHFQYNIFVSGVGNSLFENDNWRDLSFYTYIKLSAKDLSASLEGKFDGFIDKYLKSYAGLMVFRLQKLSDLHLNNEREFDGSVKGNIEKVNIMMVIGVLVLCLAAFNFINLMSVRFAHRTHEMGMKKIIGASRLSLIFQILGEALLTSFAAMALMMIAVSFIYFDSGLINFTTIPFNLFEFFPVILCSTIIVGIASGLYPAMLMSSATFKSVISSKKQKPIFSGNGFTRHALIFVQYSITIGLMITLFVVFRQLEFVRTKNLGFDKEMIITSEIWNDPSYRITREMKSMLQNNPTFSQVSVASSYPGVEPFFDHFWPEHYESHIPLRYINADPSYLKVLGIKLIDGTNFSSTPSDSVSCLINMSAMHTFGWTAEEAIGKQIRWNFGESWDNMIDGKVIGVVQDFNYNSLHSKVEPLVITMHSNLHPLILAKINSSELDNAIKQFNKIHQIANPAYPFDYTFVDETVAMMYKDEKEFSSIVTWFTASAILIATLGLFGLSSYLLEKRKKEFGIKKILGAPSLHLLVCFIKDFSIAILAASVVVSPIAAFFSKNWLAGFAYQISIPIWIFPLISILIFALVLCTVSYHVMRIVMQNPVDVIREE